MNRKFIWIVLLAILFLQGCVDIKLDTGESIQAPENKLIPIKGIWKIEGYKTKNNKLDTKEINSWLGKTAVFSEEFVAFGEEICVKPEYKVKNVSTQNYFLYTHKVNSKELEIKSEAVEVISITSNDKHFYDFVKTEENQLLVYNENVFYYLTKTSNEVNPVDVGNNLNKIKQSQKYSKKSEEDLLRSGVLIGLRSIDHNSKEIESYKTLWIAAKNRNLYPVLESKNLFVPRKSGFWIVGKNREVKEGYINDRIFANPVEKNVEEKENKEYVSQENKLRTILFVGNDYIITEYHNLQTNKYARLQVLPIDNIQKDIGVNLSDIAGEMGRDVFLSSAQGYLSTLIKSEADKLHKPTEDSFTLSRRNGHWIMKGRLYYKELDREEDYLEFNINMMPPYKIVHYNELCLSWNQIKSKIPEAVDGYTSPNKDLAIIVTKNMIYFYRIKNNQISDQYIKKIKLQEGDSVVMAEWATGSYVEKWNELFIDTGFTVNE